METVLRLLAAAGVLAVGGWIFYLRLGVEKQRLERLEEERASRRDAKTRRWSAPGSDVVEEEAGGACPGGPDPDASGYPRP